MQTATHSADTRRAATESNFTPLELETRPAVPTEQAAHYLSRKPQTLRAWACREDGPLRALRVHGRLLWPVAEIRKLLGVSK